jgi:hypothetical protein
MGRLALLGPAACAALVCAACGSSGDTNSGVQPPTPSNTGNTSPGTSGTGGAAAMPMPTDTAGTAAPAQPVAGTSAAIAGTGGTQEPTAGAGGSAEPAGPQPRTVPSLRGMCNLDTGWPGDDACLAPPPPDKGFQIHIGPDDYNDQAQVDVFVMQPGDESSQCYLKKLPIDRDVLYMQYELSGRPGTHHIINTLRTDDVPQGFGACVSFAGGSNSAGSIGGASKPHMPPIPIAPENENLGIPLMANMQAQHDMHYFNLTQEPILREFWMNVWYVDAESVTERPNRIAGLGGLSFAIAPGTHQTFRYECPVMGDGRIIQLLGHTHKHGIRETAWIRRAGSTELQQVFEQYDYLEPQIFMYDSLTMNPMFSDSAPGAHSGLLEVMNGDALVWECEVNNTSEATLRYTNFVETGEMCNIWGMTVGPTIACSQR